MARTYQELESKCDEALRQIDEQKYEEGRVFRYPEVWDRLLQKRVRGKITASGAVGRIPAVLHGSHPELLFKDSLEMALGRIPEINTDLF